MRRMMHAVAFLLAFASQLQAQSTSDLQVGTKTGSSPSIPIRQAEVNNDSEIGEANATLLVTRQNSTAPHSTARDSAPGPAHSQLAAYMSCSDWSPNLWNGYACERAAIAARISQHVDGHCKCAECKGRLHEHATGLGCSDCSNGDCSGDCTLGGCKGRNGSKLVNRYRQPISTLHGMASDSCGPSCSGSSTPCSSGNCGGVQSPVSVLTHPASSLRILTQPIAKPPRNRVATPVVNDQRNSFSTLNPEPSNVTIR